MPRLFVSFNQLTVPCGKEFQFKDKRQLKRFVACHKKVCKTCQDEQFEGLDSYTPTVVRGKGSMAAFEAKKREMDEDIRRRTEAFKNNVVKSSE